MLGRKSVLFIASDILGNIFSMISLYFVAQKLGPEPLGIIKFYSAFFSVMQFITSFGLFAYIQMVPGKKYPISQQNGALIILKISVTFIYIGICYIIAFLTKIINDSSINIFVIFSIIVFFENLQRIPHAAFAARGETAKQKFPYLLSIIVNSVGKVTSSFIYPKVIALLISELIGTIIGTFVGFKLFLKHKISLPTFQIIKDYIIFSLPLFLSNFTNKLIENLDKLILKALTDFSNVGIYAGGYSILRPLAFASSAMYLVLTPSLTKKYVKKNDNNLKQTVLQAEKILLIFCIPFLSFLMWGMFPLSNFFFGDKFYGIENIIIFLGIGLSVRLISLPYTNQIIAIGRTKLTLIPSIIIIIVNTIFDFILIPKEIFGIKAFNLGALGAAIATCIAYIIGAFTNRIIVYILTKSKSDFQNIRHMISAPIIILISLLLKNKLLFLNPIVNIILSLIFSFGFYLILNLFILKTIDKNDLNYIINSINPFKMKKYIKDEFLSKNKNN